MDAGVIRLRRQHGAVRESEVVGRIVIPGSHQTTGAVLERFGRRYHDTQHALQFAELDAGSRWKRSLEAALFRNQHSEANTRLDALVRQIVVPFIDAAIDQDIKPS